MRRLSSGFVFALFAVSLFAAAPAAAGDYLLEVQWGGAGTVDPPGPIVVPAGGSQTFTFTPATCHATGEVTVDEVPVGTGITSYTFTNVQSDHLLYVTFNPSVTFTVRPPVGQCAVPETLEVAAPDGEGAQVKFFKDGTQIGSTYVFGGLGRLILSPLPVGTYELSASVIGTSCDGANPTLDYPVQETGPVPVTLTLSLSKTTVAPNETTQGSTTLRVGGTIANTQSGQVTYYDGATPLGTVGMTNGLSNFTFGAAVGNHSITAVVHPNLCPALDLASNAVALQVYATPTSMTLTLTPSPTNEGDPTTITAVVSPQSVTGTVHFRDLTSGTDLGTAPLVNHQATRIYDDVYGANRTIQATFDGDANYGPCSASQVLRLDHTLPPGEIFQPASEIASGPNPQAVAIGDLDGDAVPDLVLANGGSNDLSILLGNGDGTFRPHEEYGEMIAPERVVIADLNGDGRADVVTASANGASVLLGNGDGTFQPTVNYGPQINWVSVGDLNGDGRLDLATTGPDNYFAVMLGNGDGTFQPRTAYYVGGAGIASVEIGDLNGDGRADVLIGNLTPYYPHGQPGFVYLTSFVSELGNGDGTFSQQRTFILGFQSQPAALLADVTQDGRLDALIARCDALGVTPGSGDGSFAYYVGPGGPGSIPYYNTGNTPWDAVVADFDGDHRPDVAASYVQGDGLLVWLGRGPYGFGSPIDFVLPAPARALAAGDLNRDTRPDLVVTDSDHAGVFVLLNAGHNGVTSVDASPDVATAIDFVAPNPSRTATRIQYTVARAGRVRVEVVDVAGRIVSTPVDGVQAAGRYQAAWHGERLPGGLYFVRLTTPDRTMSRKFTRLP